MDKFQANGSMFFRIGVNNDELCLMHLIETIEKRADEIEKLGIPKDKCMEYAKEDFQYDVYDLIPAKDFLEDVKNGSFIDYDGSIAHVFVDGFISNLGLSCRGINQGELLLTEDVWKMLMKDHEIIVNWANK